MISAFNTVYAALQGFFTRSFWFANFLPVALFAVVHAIIALLIVGPISLWGSTLSFSAVDLATASSAIILTMFMLAYLLAPIIPRLRGLLDGSLLPASVHDWLRRGRLADAYETMKAIDVCRDDAVALDDVDVNTHTDEMPFRTASRAAGKLGSAANLAKLQGAQRALVKLRRALFSSRVLAPAAKEAETAILDLLAVNNPDPDAEGVPDSNKELARLTNIAADEFEDLIDKAAKEAGYRYQIIKTRHRVFGAMDNPMATLVGDARRVTERYSEDVYGVNFEFLWPRLMAAIRAQNSQDSILAAIDTRQSALDFAIMSLMLSATLPVWLLVILYRGGSPWTFLAIGATTPLALAFFYALVVEGQLAFGDVIKAAIDQYRFQVLKTLRQPEPQSRSEEHRLWARILQADQDGRRADLMYVSGGSVK